MSQEREQIEGIVVVPEKSEELLNQRQLTDYRDHRERLIKWILNLGKDPEKAEGYAWDTARQCSYKIDKFYRWIWKQEDGYTLKATTRHAEEYSKELAYEEYSSTHKAAIQKAVKTLFKFQRYDKYTDSDKLWLTKYGNPYGTEALNRLLRKLCEEAKIPVENRDVTWYSIRHSVGTYMARDNGLAPAQAQLRHKSERTTMRYDQAPVEDRKKTLNNWD